MARPVKHLKIGGFEQQVYSAEKDGKGRNIAQTYVKHNSYDKTLHSGLADNLYSGNGTDDTPENDSSYNPFIMRALGGNKTPTGDFAEVMSIKGRTIVRNQLINKDNLPSTRTVDGITLTNNGDGSLTLNGTATANITFVVGQYAESANLSHKVLLCGCPSGGSASSYYLILANQSIGVDTGSGIIGTTNASLGRYISIVILSGTTISNKKFIPQLYDLTLMYGTGKEPTTVAEFKKDNQKAYYAYNTGSLEHLVVDGIETKGQNQWDEQWEVGGYNTLDGSKYDDNIRVRSKDYIKVIQGATYYFKTAGVNLKVCLYDLDKKFIDVLYVNNATRQLPSNVSYITFCTNDGTYGTTYNHDICINLSKASINGTYKAYIHSLHDFLTEKYQLAGIGTAQNELTKAKFTKKIKVVDMGTLNWYYHSQYSYFYTNLNTAKGTGGGLKANALCTKYIVEESWGGSLSNDKSFRITEGTGEEAYLKVRDDAYTDAQTFKTAMSGVLLAYELAQAEEETIDPELNLNFNIYADGTEDFYGANMRVPCVIRYNEDLKAKLNELNELTTAELNEILEVL